VGTALSAFVLLGVALFVPETLFDRPAPTDNASTSSVEGKEATTKELETVQVQTHTTGTTHESFTYLQTLHVGLGRHAHARGSLASYFIRPWKTLALPGTWVVMLHYAGLVGGIVTVSVIGPQLLVLPPYLWGKNAGLLNVGGLLGCLVGYLYTALLADSSLKRQAKQQHRGMAEAEDRLPTLFFPLFVATTGFFVFGFCAQYPGPTRWVGLQFGYGMLAFGLTQVPSVGFNYVSLSAIVLLLGFLLTLTAHRLVHAPGCRLFHHGHDSPIHHCLCVDILRCDLGGSQGGGGAVWHLWHVDGLVRLAHRAFVDVWEEDADCNQCQGGTSDMIRKLFAEGPGILSLVMNIIKLGYLNLFCSSCQLSQCPYFIKASSPLQCIQKSINVGSLQREEPRCEVVKVPSRGQR
jgi:hypothetical protein